MAPPQNPGSARGAPSSRLLPALFSSDNLPTSFPEHLTRPITEMEMEATDHGVSSEFRSGHTIVSDLEDHGDADYEDNDSGAVQAARGKAPSVQAPQGRKRARGTNSADVSDDRHVQRARIAGGRAPIPKKVTVDLDSDDELIKKLKDEGVRDETVRERLIAEGRTRYDAKTISTRYRRIIACLAEHEEKMLDEEFSDYREGEDELLMEAYDKCLAEYQKEQNDVEDRFWKHIAVEMKAKMDRPKYTKAICRSRYESVENGTARKPVELDSDPEAREAEIVQRRLERQRLKAEAEKEEIQRELEKDAKAEEKRNELSAKARKKASTRAVRAADTQKFHEYVKQCREAKANKERILEETRAQRQGNADKKKEAQEQMKQAQRAQRLEEALAEKDRKEEQKRQEKLSKAGEKVAKLEASLHATRNENERRERVRNQMFAGMRGSPGSGSAEAIGNAETNLNDSFAQYDDMQDNPNSDGSSAYRPTSATTTKRQSKRDSTFDTSDDGEINEGVKGATVSQQQASSDSPGYMPAHFANPESTDPRESLSESSLATLLRDRNLVPGGDRREMLQRIAEYDSELNHKDLVAILRARNFKAWGTRPMLLRRIAETDVAGFASPRAELRHVQHAPPGRMNPSDSPESLHEHEAGRRNE